MTKTSKNKISDTREFPSNSLGDNTLDFLHQNASGSYKEWNDLDESIWRSMPFIAGLGGLALTIFRLVPPRFEFSGFDIITFASASYACSILAFLIAFSYFIVLALPNEFELPSTSAKIRDHAIGLGDWYRASKMKGDLVDGAVNLDLRRLLIDQLSSAIEHNKPIIERRLSVRSRTILYLVAGFGFIILSEVATFLNQLI